MTKDVVAENVETAISALEKGEDVLLQEGDLVWLRQIMRDRSAAEPKASQLHDRENRCVLCHKYRNEGAISCANCGLDFSLNRPAEPT
jgi:hypothetical protein